MTSYMDLPYPKANKLGQFQEFIFIGNSPEKQIVDVTEQLHLAPNSSILSQRSVRDLLKITQVLTSKSSLNQLKNLEIEPGAVVEVVSKTTHGSVVVSLNQKLIGLGAEIAEKIIVTLAGAEK